MIDSVLCVLALLAAYQLRFNFQVPGYEYDLLWPILPIFLLVRAGSLMSARIHMGLVKHTSTEDARRIFLTVFAGSALFGLFSVVRFYLIDGTYFLPRTVIIIDFMATAMLLISSRIAVKLLYLRAKGSGKDEVRVVLYGAGSVRGFVTDEFWRRDILLSSAASVYRRKNLVKNAPHFAQGMYDWSLATGVNHVTVAKVRSLVGTVPDSQVSNNGRRVEIRIGL